MDGLPLAQILTGAWRPAPEPVRWTEPELADLANRLLGQRGAQNLTWWRIRSTRLARTAPGRRLRETFVQSAFGSRADEAELCKLFRLTGANGLDAVLVKGWSVARHYAQSLLRPCGDIDLCVAPAQFARAKQLFATTVTADAQLDLHAGVADLPDRTWEQVFGRSLVVQLEEVPIRVLGFEDLLRLVCLHTVRHGAYRPLWLVDVAALLEALPADFDWDYCLSGKPGLSRWVVAVIGLAHKLLGARVPDAAILERARRETPPWLEKVVLWRWEQGRETRKPLRHYFRHPKQALEALRYDGLNPIKAAYRAGVCPRHELLLLGVQLATWVKRAVELPRQLRYLLPRRYRLQLDTPLPFDIHR